MSLDDTTPIDGDGITTGVTVSELAAAIRQLKTNLNNGGLELISDSTGATKVIANDDGSVSIYTGSTERVNVDADGIIDFPKQSGCYAYLSVDQTISSGSWQLINFDTEVSSEDKQSEFNISTYRFTVTKGGIYLINLHTVSSDPGNANRAGGNIYINGSAQKYSISHSSGAGAIYTTTILKKELNTNDYIEGYAYQDSGSNLTLLSLIENTSLEIEKIA